MAVALAGCASDDAVDQIAEGDVPLAAVAADRAGEAAQSSEPPPPVRMPITMGAPSEFAMVPQVAAVAAGKVRFDIDNEGAIEHEVVVIPTDLDSGELPVDDSGAAIEAGAIHPHGGGHDDGGMKHAGVHVATGASDTVSFMLEPGNYALVCNLPGHYASGMHASFEVR